MALWIAHPCGCTADVYMGQKREKLCEHGHLFERERDDAGGSRRSSKRSEPKRDWSAARAKVDQEGVCRICKRPAAPGRPLEAAHVLGREHDEPKIGEGGRILQTLYVHPYRIIPACGPFPEGCHGDIDMRRINLLPHLTLAEQLQAVKDAGGIEAARIRLEPVTHREEVEASSATARAAA